MQTNDNAYLELLKGLPFIKQSQSEGLIKSTTELILIDNFTDIPTIKCPSEVQNQLRFVGFKGITDYIFN